MKSKPILVPGTTGKTGSRIAALLDNQGHPMKMSKFQKTVLGVAGFTALAIGAFILIEPYAFYASYGITLAADPNLLSELRGPAANLTALGAVMLAGLFRPSLARISSAIALIVFLAFPVGRVFSIALDGVPSDSVLAALAIEIVIGALLLIAFGKRPESKPLSTHTSCYEG